MGWDRWIRRDRNFLIYLICPIRLIFKAYLIVPLIVILPDQFGARGVLIIQCNNDPHDVVVCVVGIGLAETKFNVPGQ